MEDQGLTDVGVRNSTQTADVEVGLSLSQREVWLDQSAWPDSAHLNIGGGAYLHGKFDLGIFKSALTQLVAENQALRLVPHLDGSQLLLGHFEPALEIVEIGACSDPMVAIRDGWNQRIKIPFALGNQPPWRFTLLRANENLHGLTIQFHHLVMDGWATSLVMQRWSEIYNGLALGTRVAEPKSPNYGVFIEESNEYKDSIAFQRDAEFWLQQVPQLPPLLIDRRFPQARQGGLADCDLAVKLIPREQYDAMSRFAIQNNVTNFTIFLAALAVYFSKICQRQELLIGVPSLNRGGRRHRETMGMFVGVMAIEVQVAAGMAVSALLEAITAKMRSTLRHPRYPLSELGRRLDLIKAGRDGLFDVLLSFERQDYKLNFGDAELRHSRQLFSGKARYPLGVTVCEFHQDEDVELVLEGSTACFGPGETHLLAQRVWELAHAMVASPATLIENLSIVPAAERLALVVDELHAGLLSCDPPEPYILQFERRVAMHPQALAVVWDQQSISYAGLNLQANRLARRLKQFGLEKNSIIAFAIERSVEMLVAVLAVAKAGAAFLPLDPDAPVARMGEILQESKAGIFLIKEQDQDRLAHLHRRTLIVDWDLEEADGDVLLESNQANPATLAYVLFTSGSTGRPKGVMIDHATLSRRLKWLSRNYGVTAQDRTAQATQITFDPSLIEICLPLIHGASIALPPPGRILPESLAEFAETQGVTIMAFVPSTLSKFLDAAAGRTGLKLRVACCGGEVLPRELAYRYLSITNARLFNVYGPTETAIFATAWECHKGALPDVLPIGKPIDDTHIYILDVNRNLLPFGVVGEIYIGGNAIAQGYLNRPDLTAGAFLDDSYLAGGRMYKTGDRGWLAPDGQLNFVGRNDRQVKLRGYRIELGEIESALSSIEGVSQAAATLIDRDGKQQIQAWVAANAKHTPESLQKILRLRLPSYMIPGGVEILNNLPESSVGKIDYAALPLPRGIPQIAASRLPDNQLESDLLSLWQKVLVRPELTVTDNFFDVGGDSLAAVSILTGIEKMIGRRVPMYLITERPTVEGLAAALGEGTASTGLMVKLGGEALAGHTNTTPKALVYFAASGHGDLMRFQALAAVLDDVCEIRMLQPPSASTIAKTVDLAALYAKVVVAQGGGPCYLAGFSVGGLAALETSRLLQASSVDVRALFLVDTIYPSRLWGGTFFWRLLRRLVALFNIQDLSMNGRRLGVMLNDPGLFSQVMAVSGYRAAKFGGTTHLVKSAGFATRMDSLMFLGWRQLFGKNLQEHQVKGLHGSMFDNNNIGDLAKVFRVAVASQPITK